MREECSAILNYPYVANDHRDTEGGKYVTYYNECDRALHYNIRNSMRDTFVNPRSTDIIHNNNHQKSTGQLCWKS